MTLPDIKKELEELNSKFLVLSRYKLDLKKVVSDGSYILDYHSNKAKYMTDRVRKMAESLVASVAKALDENKNKRLDDVLEPLKALAAEIRESYLEPSTAMEKIAQMQDALEAAEKIEDLENEINEFEKEAAARPVPKLKSVNGDVKLNFNIPDLPEEISENIGADVNELEMCFYSGCYRSSIILCGRIIETALHRKYFEVTGNDALEKEPGIGLGKLIARMSEKNVKLDPGLPQQIHFINQVRIFSVHTKQQAFNPSMVQAQATILYTLDVLGKLFQNI